MWSIMSFLQLHTKNPRNERWVYAWVEWVKVLCSQVNKHIMCMLVKHKCSNCMHPHRLSNWIATQTESAACINTDRKQSWTRSYILHLPTRSVRTNNSFLWQWNLTSYFHGFIFTSVTPAINCLQMHHVPKDKRYCHEQMRKWPCCICVHV